MGRSGSAPRMANNDDVFNSVFNSSPANGTGVRRSNSGAGYDDVFGGPPMATNSSNDAFGDLLGGFNASGSRPQPSQNSFTDDLLGGFSASKPPQSTAHTPSSSLDDIFSGGYGRTRTSSQTSSVSQKVDDPFSTFSMPRPAPKVTQSQTMFDNDWDFSASKPAPRGGTLHASFDGDLLGGFSTSTGRPKQPVSNQPQHSSPPRSRHSEPLFDDYAPGFGGGDQGKKKPVADADAMRGIPIINTDDDDVFSNIPSSTPAPPSDPFGSIPPAKATVDADASRGVPLVTPLDADEMRGIPTMNTSPTLDDDPFSSAVEEDPFAKIIKDSAPPAYADPSDPFYIPPASGSSSSNTTDVSKNQDDNGSGPVDPFDGFPHPSPVATSQSNEDTASNRSLFHGREGSQDSGTWDEKSSRRDFGSVPFNVNPKETPEVASPTYPSGRYEATAESESNGFVPKFDSEPKFDEPSLGANKKHDTDKVPVDIFEENWLTVDDVKLTTSPSRARPPSRAPPRPGSDRTRIPRSSGIHKDSVGERSRGRSDEFPVYGSRPNGSDVSKEAELARERAAAREREASLVQKEREAAERERAGMQKERERQRERERQMDRLREQEAGEAGERAKKAAEKAAQEAQYRVEKAAAERAIAEARERAERASAARQTDESAERAKKAAERAAQEAQHRMEKAAAERAIAEARERAERAALQRAAAARDGAREKEQREKDQKEREERARAKEERQREKERREKEEREKERERDRERDRRRERERGAAEPSRSAGASSRATSEPKQRPPNHQPAASFGGDVRRPSPSNPVYSSTGSSPAPTPPVRKPQPQPKVVDDWTTLLTQTAPTGDEFQEIPGESAERTKARLERHQKALERAQQALREKNERDQAQLREQAERSMAAGNLDAEIRRWATGKEGNLRALLSSLHLILWPDTNWKPVSLTDLITGISVKKSYQRAILCVHPDKVQQKGATVQQKYIAEKVFDLLKEAFAKFNSTELY